MNTLTRVSIVLLLTALLSADLMAQRGGRGQGRQGNQDRQSAQINRGRNGQGQQNQDGQKGRRQASAGSLSSQERSDLILMREEEKLAHDVYVAMQKKWNARIFTNIAQAETRHMESVASLLSRYQIPDPVVSNTPGTFTNPKFQQLYKSLVNKGSTSLVDAFKVSLKIEEMDIADLQVALKSTDNQDIGQVYQHLEQGSRNHLRAFATQLKNAGGTYVATQLSQREFNSIANGSTGQGGQLQQGRGNRFGRGGIQGQQSGNGQGRGYGQGRGNGKGRGGKGNQGGK